MAQNEPKPDLDTQDTNYYRHFFFFSDMPEGPVDPLTLWSRHSSAGPRPADRPHEPDSDKHNFIVILGLPSSRPQPPIGWKADSLVL